MQITFDIDPQGVPLFAISASSEPTRDGLVVTMNVSVAEPPNSIVPARLMLEPEVARELATLLAVQAPVVERWRRN
jgi:hypothetical protein